MLVPAWQEKANAKVAETHSKIPKEWLISGPALEDAKSQRDITGPYVEQYLSAKEIEIIHNDSTALISKIKMRKYTSLEVAKAYCHTAAVAHQINNCLHEIMFDLAFHTATYLDQYQKDTGRVKGPLHGLPVSLKDQFHVKGHDTSMGYVGWIGNFEGLDDPKKVHRVESQLVGELEGLGAVLFCKTSVPQTLLMGETVNNIIGSTRNPHNTLLSCGGSSGGEGALLALHGSSVGLGTDIGGSVRIPAAFCGAYALKPTSNRLSYRDMANSNPGEPSYPSSVGILSTSLDAIELLMKSILSTEPWLRDPKVAKMPWNDAQVASSLARAKADGSARMILPLRIAFHWHDGIVKPHPPICRGLRMMRDALVASGHKVFDWDPPSHATTQRIHLSMLQTDGGHDIHKQLRLSGEPLIPRLRDVLAPKDPMSIVEYQDLVVEGRAFQEAYSDYLNSTGGANGQPVDAIVMPVAAHAAIIPGKYRHGAYTGTTNLLDYTCAVLPVTKADKSIDTFDDDYIPMTEADRINWQDYDPDIYDGAPVGLQIVGRKHEEEKILAITKIVDACLKMRNGQSDGEAAFWKDFHAPSDDGRQ